MEFKAAGQRMSMGQRIALQAMRKLPNTDVMVVYGPDKNGLYLVTWYFDGKLDDSGLKSIVKHWWDTKKGVV